MSQCHSKHLETFEKAGFCFCFSPPVRSKATSELRCTRSPDSEQGGADEIAEDQTNQIKSESWKHLGREVTNVNR